MGTEGGVFISTDNGSSWTQGNNGLTNTAVQSLVINSSGFIFAGTEGGVVFRSLNSTTNVKVQSAIPNEFALHQNYPNPFNPTTTISFSLPSRSVVSLKIFDVMGREISTIVSGELQAGSYTRQWNASAFSSGVYFYRMEAGRYVETKEVSFDEIVSVVQRHIGPGHSPSGAFLGPQKLHPRTFQRKSVSLSNGITSFLEGHFFCRTIVQESLLFGFLTGSDI